MADGNELDDDITSDSVVYSTGVFEQQSFLLPVHGFNTKTQRDWADRVTQELLETKKLQRITSSQVDNANRLANETNKAVGDIIYAESEDNEVPLERPSTPTTQVRLGTIEVIWDGLDWQGTVMGSGFSNLSVYAVKTSDVPEGADFSLQTPYNEGDIDDPEDPGETEPGEPVDPDEPEPDPDPVNENEPATKWPPRSLGSISVGNNGGSVVLTNLEYNQDYTIWTIASDIRGNTTEASDRVIQKVIPLVDTDIIGRVIDGNNIALESLNKELLDEGLAGELSDLEAAASRRSILLRNYSFEVDDDAWGFRWADSEGIPTVRKEIPDAKEGTWVLSSSGIVGEPSVAAQVINAYPGDFQARFFYRSTLAHANAFYVTCLGVDSSGTPVTIYSSWSPPAPASVWTEGVADLKIPADADPNLTIILAFIVTNAEVDDVSLYDVSPVRARNGNIYSENPPSGTGDGEGSTWFQWDSSKNIIGMWSWDGTSWVPMELRDEVIGNLNAGKIDAGFISSDRVEVNSLAGNKITVNTLNGDRVITNSLNADKIVGNSITGEKIAALTIEAGNLAANSITADKIQAGAITGSLLEGKVIATALTGQRTQLDVTGLRTFNSAGTQTSALSAASGGMNLSGNLVVSGAIRTSASNARLQFDGSGISGYNSSGSRTGAIELSSQSTGLAFIGNSYFSNNTEIGADRYLRTQSSSTFNGGLQIVSNRVEALAPMQGTSTNLRLRAIRGTAAGAGSEINLEANQIFSTRTPALLWSGGGIFVNNNQTINFSESMSSQLSGIVMAWSGYSDGSATDGDWNFVFVPKSFTSLPGTGVSFQLAYGTTQQPRKYVYVGNTSISGVLRNGQSPNNVSVLRAVYGV